MADFTLIGATTDPDGLIGPLIDRFRMVLHLDYYSESELAEIARHRCRAMGWDFESELLSEIAMRAKGTPRLALRLLQSARRCSVAEGSSSLEVRHLTKACDMERVSSLGLDNLQQRYIALLKDGPLRLNVLASALGVSSKVLVKTVEPYLIRAAFVLKDDGGRRQLSERAREHLSEFGPATE